MKSIITKPIFFEKNRVWRVYTGGKLFADFFGDDSEDGFEPEEWLASSVRALNKVSKGPKEGISRVVDTDLYFDDLLLEYPKEMLGERTEMGMLIKMLDSAIRLPAQAHPDKAFAKAHFDSEYGKTESWVILGTREDAAIYFGFKEKISKEEFAKAVEQSEQDKTIMEGLLNRVPVQVGDVFLVPARMMHAIGKGCLILEIQEPTDFTVQPEYWCGDYHLDDHEMYIGLQPDVALDVFDYETFGREAVERGRCVPKTMKKTEHCVVEDLITYEDTPCFAVKRYTIQESEMSLNIAPAVYVVTEGTGEVICGEYRRTVKKGDYFFLPYAAKEGTYMQTKEEVQVIACLPPKK